MLGPTRHACFSSVAVWGGGTIGSGIAQVAAQAALPVTVVDVSQSRLDISRRNVEFSLSRIAKKKFGAADHGKVRAFVDETVCHITFTTDEKAAAGGADLIIEAIVENIDAKRELFGRLDKLAPKSTVFCSNTSSLRIGDMASATSRPDRFAGIHFFSPVPMMKLVEVVRTDSVNPDVITQLLAFAKSIGKTPVVAKDTKGFIVNRLLVPYQLDACRLVERGVASFQDVDTAMKLGCGYPMGPFELADSVGMDDSKSIVDGWHKDEPENPMFFPCKLTDDMVAAGKLGRKTGEGFYKYDKKGRKLE